MNVGGVEVSVQGDGPHRVLRWSGGLQVDADGAPRAYHPQSNLGLDRLANAGRPGHWWGVVTDTGEPGGHPLVQVQGDPAPGFYVSCTALQDHSRALGDQRRYVDACQVPYLSVPPELRQVGVLLGDVGVAVCGRLSQAFVVADVGPHGELGEGSVALARALGLDADPRRGGMDAGVEFVLFAGSAAGWPRAEADWQHQAFALYAANATAVT